MVDFSRAAAVEDLQELREDAFQDGFVDELRRLVVDEDARKGYCSGRVDVLILTCE